MMSLRRTAAGAALAFAALTGTAAAHADTLRTAPAVSTPPTVAALPVSPTGTG